MNKHRAKAMMTPEERQEWAKKRLDYTNQLVRQSEGRLITKGKLVELCRAVNSVIRSPDGRTDYCIFASAILQDVLLALGHDASVLRVEAVILPDDHDAVTFGGFGDGTRRPAAGPGEWRGHLIAVRVVFGLSSDQAHIGQRRDQRRT